MLEEQGWKTEEYRSALMRVRANRRAGHNPALTGHGEEWDFTVENENRDRLPAEVALPQVVRSDPAVFYSTQAIAENMAFIKGREVIEHRSAPGDTLSDRDHSVG
ncbi:MAG: hypothetical protein H7327_10115 [Herminiimonas sp.]|nr:hypothetical protein [Herminiimonas sp.]